MFKYRIITIVGLVLFFIVNSYLLFYVFNKGYYFTWLVNIFLELIGIFLLSKIVIWIYNNKGLR